MKTAMINTAYNDWKFKVRASLAALLLCVIAAGCAGLPTDLQAPAVTIADIGLGGASLFEQRFNLKLRIQNPNAVDLRIDGIAFDFEVNDQLLAQGVGNRGITVPRYGSGLMEVEAVSSLGGWIKQVGTLARGDQSAFKYRIKGTLSLSQDTRVPFERGGEFDLGAIVPK